MADRIATLGWDRIRGLRQSAPALRGAGPAASRARGRAFQLCYFSVRIGRGVSVFVLATLAQVRGHNQMPAGFGPSRTEDGGLSPGGRRTVGGGRETVVSTTGGHTEYRNGAAALARCDL